ncbi:hypothetical protein KDM41_14160 [bacterium]|nr:hypothetical protein [bacterium]
MWSGVPAENLLCRAVSYVQRPGREPTLSGSVEPRTPLVTDVGECSYRATLRCLDGD